MTNHSIVCLVEKSRFLYNVRSASSKYWNCLLYHQAEDSISYQSTMNILRAGILRKKFPMDPSTMNPSSADASPVSVFNLFQVIRIACVPYRETQTIESQGKAMRMIMSELRNCRHDLFCAVKSVVFPLKHIISRVIPAHGVIGNHESLILLISHLGIECVI